MPNGSKTLHGETFHRGTAAEVDGLDSGDGGGIDLLGAPLKPVGRMSGKRGFR
jgi:hypothetical protein